MKTIFTLIFCLGTGLISAQKIEPKWTFNVELGLPTSVANQPFDDIMQGLVNASVYQQYSAPFHLNVGLGFRYTLMTINEFKVQTPVRGNMQTGCIFLKVGWDKYLNDRLALDFSVKFGYGRSYFSTDLNENKGVNPVLFEKVLIEPTAAMILSADERNSYRWCLGYAINGFGFSPQVIGMDDNSGYDPSNFERLTQYLVIGFGYTFYFGVKPQE